MGFLKQLLIKANFDKKRAEKMLKSDKPDAYIVKSKYSNRKINLEEDKK